ncbi:MAG: hypothetical protein J7L11_02760 [Thermoprotei archaeon]|nr:hypothetical protein [Thermoprotei archaeon]
MNSRERCLRSIKHEEVDRVPLILRIRPEPWIKLKRYLGVMDDEKVYRWLGVDIRGVGIGLKGGYEVRGAKYGERGWVIEEGPGFQVEQNIFGYRLLFHRPHTHTFTYIYHPLQHMSLEEYEWPEVREEDFDKVVRLRRRYEDFCLYGGVTHMWEVAWKLTGFNTMMKMLFTRPKEVEAILDNLHRIRMQQAKLLCEAGVDVIYDGDDVGMQKGMMISPTMWRRLLKPRYAELVSLCHRYGAFFLFHSDGWIEPIIRDLIEIGVDILNPVQPECMDPAEVHARYGDELCFDGTLSIQHTIPFGSVEDVVREVRERIETIGYTGLILGPSHAIQPEAPVENIIAIYTAARKYGRNPSFKRR